MSGAELAAIAPLVYIVLLAIAIVVADILAPGRHTVAAAVAGGGYLVGIAIVAIASFGDPVEAFGGAYVRDALTGFLDLLFLAIGLLTVLFAPDYLRVRRLPMAELAATLTFALAGAMLLAGARDLLVLFLALELLVLPGYMLAGYAKGDAYSTEGAIKYFLLGSFSSAIFLFGLALTWGFTGTTRVGEVASVFTSALAGGAPPPGLAVALAFMTTGVAFKIAAVPFHYWTPDAYQGSPTPITGYLSVGPKIAAFALILRLFVEALAPLKADWTPVLWVLAALTMTVGNLIALTQDNIKRMLAYSSIAHTGYMLVGLAAYAAAPANSPAEKAGLEGLLYYAAAYSFMNLGAFAVVSLLQGRPGVTSQIESFAGLARRELVAAVLMTLFLLSLVGIPPLAGFFAKAYIVLAAVEVGGWLAVLAVIVMLNAAAAAFYYLRIVVVMWMRDAPANAPAIRSTWPMQVGLATAAALTILIGVLPGGVINLVGAAAAALP